MRKLFFFGLIHCLSLMSLLVLATPAHARIHWISQNTFEVSNVRLERPNDRWRVIEQEAPLLVKMVYFQNGENAEITLTWQPPLDAALSRIPQNSKRFDKILKKTLLQELDMASYSASHFSRHLNWVFLQAQNPKDIYLASFRFADATLKGPYLKIEMRKRSRHEDRMIHELSRVEKSLVILDSPMPP